MTEPNSNTTSNTTAPQMDPKIRAEVTVLTELKRLDEADHRLRVGLNQIPDEIALIDKKLRDHESTFIEARAAVSDVEKKLRSAEGDLKSKEDELFKAEGKMMEVKTNEEYQAAMRENESRKQSKGLLEERVLQLMDSLEEQRRTLQGMEKEHGSQKSGLVNERAKLESQRKTLEQDVAEHTKRRNELLQKLQPKTRSIYTRTSNGGQNSAIAAATNGSCAGCHMQVRPQQYNEVIGFVAIHQCGHCTRILIPVLTPDRDAQPEQGVRSTH